MNRRKRKLVRMDLQFKVVFSTLFVASFVLLVNFLLVSAALWTLSVRITDPALSEVQRIFRNNFFFSLAVAVPLSVTVGILYSFKFSGPIYRFKKYFIEVVQGRWAHRCTLRKGDLLVDMADAINAAMDRIRERMKANHELLAEIGTVLESGTVSADRERVVELKARIAEEAEIYMRHLGSPEPLPQTPACPSPQDKELVSAEK